MRGGGGGEGGSSWLPESGASSSVSIRPSRLALLLSMSSRSNVNRGGFTVLSSPSGGGEEGYLRRNSRAVSAISPTNSKGPPEARRGAPTRGHPWVHNLAAVGGRGTGAVVAVRQVAGESAGATADPRAADPRAGTAGVAADRITVGSSQVRAGCSCPPAASAGPAVADMADAAAAGSAGTAVDCDYVVAVVGVVCVVVAVDVAVAVLEVVILRKMLLTLPDSAAESGFSVAGAVEFLGHSWPVQTPAAATEVVRA